MCRTEKSIKYMIMRRDYIRLDLCRSVLTILMKRMSIRYYSGDTMMMKKTGLQNFIRNGRKIIRMITKKDLFYNTKGRYRFSNKESVDILCQIK